MKRPVQFSAILFAGKPPGVEVLAVPNVRVKALWSETGGSWYVILGERNGEPFAAKADSLQQACDAIWKWLDLDDNEWTPVGPLAQIENWHWRKERGS